MNHSTHLADRPDMIVEIARLLVESVTDEILRVGDRAQQEQHRTEPRSQI